MRWMLCDRLIKINDSAIPQMAGIISSVPAKKDSSAPSKSVSVKGASPNSKLKPRRIRIILLRRGFERLIILYVSHALTE